MDNLEKLAITGTQDTGQTIKNHNMCLTLSCAPVFSVTYYAIRKKGIIDTIDAV
jgi:hypothetical protein